jgi:TDG/mug DNA glycosylase family protein
MLPDLLAPNLQLVICGTAAGAKSAQKLQYYAGRGNKFWSTLEAVGLTSNRIDPADYKLLLKHGIGLTDVVKGQSGMDRAIEFSKSDPNSLRARLFKFQPKWLCFNGKKAAQVFLGKSKVEFGIIEEQVGGTRLFIAPSTSGAANGTWDIAQWHEIAGLAR